MSGHKNIRNKQDKKSGEYLVMPEIEELNNRYANMIQQNNIGIKESMIDQLMADIVRVMGNQPDSRITLGPLLGQLKGLKNNSKQKKEEISWVDILGGSIAIGHRPKIKSLEEMRAVGITHILTLLSEKEGAKDIEKAVNNNGLKWIWLPLSSAETPDEAKTLEIIKTFGQCENELKKGARIYIHCSAGIHRTGMITYALLRYIGVEGKTAMQMLSKLRGITADGVGSERLAWGDSVPIKRGSNLG